MTIYVYDPRLIPWRVKPQALPLLRPLDVLRFPMKSRFGVSGTDYAELDSVCGLRLAGDATNWNDVNFDGLSLGAGASAPDLVSLYASGGIKGRAFDGATVTEQLFGSGEILHGYLEGSDIVPHVHWMPTTVGTGNVKWQLEYSWANTGGAFSAPTTISVVAPAGGTAWMHNISSFGAVTGAGKKIGSQFSFRLFRDPTDSDDTYAADAALLSVGVHYIVEMLGSRTSLAK